MSRTEKGISVVIPVYNSGLILPELVSRLTRVLAGTGLPYEVILVNDGSRDASWKVTCALVAQDPCLHGVCLMRNYGQHNALLCGIREARFDWIVTMDDDLQNPPEEIPKLLAAMADGWDVVYGTPECEKHGLLRDIASVFTKAVLQKAMGAPTARQVSAFRIFRAQVREAFSNYRGSFVSIDVLLTWGASQFFAIKVRHDGRISGRSNYSVAKLIRHALNMLTGFSTLPLQVASFVGFAFTVFGFGVLAYVVGRYLLQGNSVPGFPFLASIIAIFSGAQLFAIGIIGEYLARMHFRTMDRPAYTVRTVVEQPSARHEST